MMKFIKFTRTEVQGKNPKSKTTNHSEKASYEPRFSPDGEWIVFESHLIDIEEDGIITKYKIDGSSSYIELTE